MQILTLLASLVLVPMVEAAPAAAGLDAIAAYAGTWKSEVKHLATPYSKAATERTTLHNDCWRGTLFYACEQIVNSSSTALVVFTYDAKSDIYHNYAVPADGSKAYPGGTLIIKANVWTFPWTDTENGKAVYFRVLNTWSSPDSIEFRQEFSNDNQHWTVMATGHETRVK